MSQFSFLEAEFGEQFEAAERAERYALADPGTAVIHARRALESGVKWVYSHDRAGHPDPVDRPPRRLGSFGEVGHIGRWRHVEVLHRAGVDQELGGAGE